MNTVRDADLVALGVDIVIIMALFAYSAIIVTLA